jgi:HD-GYP domain-containing protein (c-di-GMP phosphodiesterase class II)
MTSDRPYRPRRTPSAALAEIRQNVGTQFCPIVVGALETEYNDRSSILHATDQPSAELALTG